MKVPVCQTCFVIWLFIELPKLFIQCSTMWLLQAPAIVFFCVGGLEGIQLEEYL